MGVMAERVKRSGEEVMNGGVWKAVFVLSLALLAACQKAEERKDEPGPKVEGEKVVFAATQKPLPGIVLEPVRTGVERKLRLPGRLVWNEDRTARIYSPFAGRVERILVQPGTRVSAGQALAELASPDFGSAQAEYRKASADLSLARQNAERQRELHAHGVAAARELQQAEADFARAESEAARAGERIKLYGGSQNVDQRLMLKSPIAGVVVEKAINPGQEVRPDAVAPLFVVTDPSELWVQLEAAEGDLAGLKPGVGVELVSAQYPGERFAAEVVQVADFVDPATRTVKVRGKVANPERRLKGEMYVSGEISFKGEGGLFVPAKAVYLSGAGHFVFVAGNERSFERREVSVGAESQGMLAVLAGLKEGEQVVSEGNLYLQQILRSQRRAAK